ncbi:MAG: HAD hydrolase-like protein, partial [Christensenellaceae bacterium]|nr:HAD hydrolase-like protein [Christensenellaceae bacterium]
KAEVIRYILEENGLTDADKPRMVMAGDRRHDVEGAKATGIECIGCVYGYGGREELITAGADALADTIPQLTQMLLS